MKTVWTRIGLVAAALAPAQLFLFGPVDIWARNAAEMSLGAPHVAAAGALAFFALFIPLAAVFLLTPLRWRPALASILAAVALLVWIYSSLLFRESLALDGRDRLFDLTSRLGAAEMPLLALSALALAFALRHIPRQCNVLLLVLLIGNVALTITSLVTVRAGGPQLAHTPADPLWRFARADNVLAILLDGLQSDVASEELKNDASLAADFRGFTFFNNTTGVAPTTFPTMPTIHSGQVWDPDRSLVEQYEENVRKGSFLAGLARSGFEVTMIEPARNVCPEGIALCAHTGIAVGPPDGCPGSATLCRITSKVAGPLAAGHVPQIALLFDMSLARAAPYALKRHVYNSGNWMLSNAMTTAFSAQVVTQSRDFLDAFAAKVVAGDGPPAAKFFHISSTHQPYAFGADCRHQPPAIAGGMENAARCSLRSVGAILKRLDTLGIYDSATVLVFADHGAGRPSRYRTDAQRSSESWPMMAALANPVLMVKPPFARGPLHESMREASVADIAATVCGLTTRCVARGGRSLFAAAQPEVKSSRLFRYYQWRIEYWTLKSIPGVTSFDIVGPPWEPASWRTLGTAPRYELGSAIDFRSDGNAARYLDGGWAESEAWGTWAEGGTARLRLSPGPVEKTDLTLSVQARAFLVPEQPRQDIDVLVNGRLAGRWSFDKLETEERELLLPADLVGNSETIEIAFVTTAARSPAQLGISDDRRRLSIGIAEASLRVGQPDGPRMSQAARYTLGDALDFTAGGNVAPYLGSGWSQPEAWGTWTDGDMAILRLAPAARAKSDLVLRIRASGLTAAQLPRQEVAVRVNGRPVGSWAFDGAAMVERELRIPADLWGDVLEIAFVPKDPRSPAELGVSPDSRRLGMAVAEVTLRPAAP